MQREPLLAPTVAVVATALTLAPAPAETFERNAAEATWVVAVDEVLDEVIAPPPDVTLVDAAAPVAGGSAVTTDVVLPPFNIIAELAPRCGVLSGSGGMVAATVVPKGGETSGKVDVGGGDTAAVVALPATVPTALVAVAGGVVEGVATMP